MFNAGERLPKAVLTSFADISDRLQAETALQHEKESLAKLLAVSEEFLANSESELDLQKITDNLLQISGGKFAVFNLFDANGRDFQTVAISGLSEQFQKFTSVLGFDLSGKKWPHDPLRAAKTRDKLITHFNSLFDITGDALPKPALALVNKIFKAGEVVVAKIFANGQVLGDFTIIMPAGENFAADNQVTIYLRQLGLLLQRKQAEAALRASQQDYRQLVEQVPEVIYTDEIGGGWQYLGPNIQALCGHTADELIADSSLWLNMIQVEDRDQLETKIKALRAGDVLNAEYRIQTRDHGQIWVRDHGVVKEDSSTGRKLIQGLLTDVTKQKVSETALAQAHAQLNDVMNSTSQVSIIATDISGLILTFNSGSIRMLGYSADEFVNKQTPAILHLESEVTLRGRELTEELGYPVEGFEVFVALARQGKYDQREWTYVRKDGTHLTVNLGVTAVRNDAEQIIGFLGIANDVTERKQAEAALLEAKNRLSMATKAGGIGIWDLDPVRNQGIWDEQMFRLYGFPSGSGRDAYATWQQGVHPEDRERSNQEIQMALRGEKEFDSEFRVIWPDGSIHHIHALS
ncbi:MAG: PAS domain S-box protein, partial [Chloroflexi bacterium]|nr:PAS domain S-box protein [Chloroflexota bacterium]